MLPHFIKKKKKSEIIYKHWSTVKLTPLTDDVNSIDLLATVQSSAVKPLILTFMDTTWQYIHLPQTPLQTKPTLHSTSTPWSQGVPQQDNAYWYTTKTAQELPKEHKKIQSQRRPKIQIWLSIRGTCLKIPWKPHFVTHNSNRS